MMVLWKDFGFAAAATAAALSNGPIYIIHTFQWEWIANEREIECGAAEGSSESKYVCEKIELMKYERKASVWFSLILSIPFPNFYPFLLSLFRKWNIRNKQLNNLCHGVHRKSEKEYTRWSAYKIRISNRTNWETQHWINSNGKITAKYERWINNKENISEQELNCDGCCCDKEIERVKQEFGIHRMKWEWTSEKDLLFHTMLYNVLEALR